MSFLNPGFLGALALAAIPLLIHLIRRRKIRIVPWAAWDFLRQASRRNRRRLRIEQLLLLLVRVALICLVVLAFSRPVLRTLGLPLVGRDARVHAVIVLDCSFSMGYRQDGVPLFARAKAAADQILARVLRQGDSVSVILLSSKPVALIGQPTLDLRRARERVRAVPLSDRGTDHGAAAALCAELLRSSPARVREVYWITDSQRAGFRDDERSRQAWRDLARMARITWVDVGPGPRENLAVHSVRVGRDLVTPQAPVRIEAAVRSHSRSILTGVEVLLSVDGRPAGSTRVNLPPGGEARAQFVYLFDRPGVHTGAIRLARGDSLPRDDAASFAVRVRSRLRILVLNGGASPDPAKDEAFYLATALSPAGASEGARTAIQPTVRSPVSLDGVALRDQDAVALTGLARLSDGDRGELAAFVRAGGGLLVLPNPAAEPAVLNASLGELAPARVAARRAVPGESAPSLNPASIRHPALDAFRDTSEIDLSSARFPISYLLEEPRSEAASVMVRFSTGQPALVEKRLGLGRVVLAGFTAGATGSTLPYKAAYVPLAHQLVSWLAAGPSASRTVEVGQPITVRFSVADAGRGIRLTDPRGTVSVHQGVLGADGVQLTFAGTERAGTYQVSLAGRGVVDAWAVVLPPGESDLTPADERAVRAALGGAPIQHVADPARLEAAVRAARGGVEVWRSLVLGSLGLLFLEALLAQRFGRRG